MMVYLIDRRANSAGVPEPAGLAGLRAPDSHDFEGLWRRVIESLPGHHDAQIVFANATDDIQSLVRQVIELVRTPWSIWMLRILAHGRPGYIELGTGVEASRARNFSVLARYMTPQNRNGRGVQIHGCNVGESRHGRQLLQALADAVGMPVSASPQVQRPDTHFSFEGPSITLPPRHTHRAAH